MTQALLALIGLAIGGAASVWLVPAQWDLIIGLGFVIGFVISAGGAQFRAKRTPGAAVVEPHPGVNGVRGIAIVLALVAGFALWLISYLSVARWADPSLLSFAYFACAALAGLSVSMLINARKMAQASGWNSTEEVAG